MKNLRLKQLFLAFVFLTVNGCGESFYWSDKVHQEIMASLQQKEIKVLILDKPLNTIDQDLLSSFAHEFNLKIKTQKVSSEMALFDKIKKGEADLGAARLRRPPFDSASFQFGPSYEESSLSLFCQRSLHIEKFEDLNEHLVLVPYRDRKNPLFNQIEKISPKIEFEFIPSEKNLENFLKIENKKASCVVTEKWEGLFNLRQFPNIEHSLDLPSYFTFQWVLNSNNPDLKKALDYWHQKIIHNGELQSTLKRYKYHLLALNQKDVKFFSNKIKKVLPQYLSVFKKAAAENALEWQLVAAVGFQESHWKLDAESATGVRGLMQLTTHTAEFMGIKDRKDPHQSIEGGARYIKTLLNNLPEDLNFREKLAFALASYNLGPAHIKDLQSIAIEKNLNPWSWESIEKLLPLIEDDETRNQVEYSPARGLEAFNFVRRVLGYYEILTANT